MHIEHHNYVPTSDKHPSLAWLLISAIGAGLAAIVVAGVLAGRFGLPIEGSWLVAAAAAGALPQLLVAARGRWAARWPELIATLLACTTIGGVGLALAWPSMLPLGLSVDAVHHTQMIAWIAEHRAFPTPSGDTQKLLGEMAAYPVGLALLVLAASALTGAPLLETTYPSVAVLGGLIAGLVVLLSNAAARSLTSGDTGVPRRNARPGIFGLQSAILQTLALLSGPILLLAHRSYMMEAYIDHSYYTMVLGIFLALLAAAWLIVEPRLSWPAAAQFGLALAALAGTYPLWVPLPAVLAAVTILARQSSRRRAASDRRAPIGLATLGLLLLALGPAFGLGLIDVLPRLGIGQKVLEHEGLVTLPNLERLTPILLALPSLLLLVRGRSGRRLVGLAGLAGLAALVLALAAWAGRVAGYHGYKLLFLLTPLAAAIVGAAALRLLQGRAATTPATQRAADIGWSRPIRGISRYRGPRPSSVAPILGLAFARAMHGAALIDRPLRILQPQTSARTHGAGAKSPAYSKRLTSGQPAGDWRQPWLVLGTLALVLAATDSLKLVPPPAIQLLSPDLVAAARWLRAEHPRDAARAMAVGLPIGPVSYWVEVGLLGQRRDKAASAMRGFTDAPPSPESWLVNGRGESTAIVLGMQQSLLGVGVLARFGSVVVARHPKQIDIAQLNPLVVHYQAAWDKQQVQATIDLQRPLAGPLPLVEIQLLQNGQPLASYALPPEQQRTRTQYLGIALQPGTLAGSGYINQSAYPVFAPPNVVPSGALELRLRLSLNGNTLDERTLATFEREPGGQIARFASSSGELVYLRHAGSASLQPSNLAFGAALRLSGWSAPEQAHAGEPLAITLRWEAQQPIDRSLFPEIQLLDASGQAVASNLAAPQGGFYPTWRWRPGESVIEQRSLQLPADLAPGTYRLAMQVHDFVAGRTLGAAALGQVVVR